MFRHSQIRLPFDWKTPLGYLFALLFQTMAVYASVLSTIPAACTLIASAWTSVATLKDFTNDLPLLMIGGRSLNNRTKIKKRFSNFVQFYLDLKELSVWFFPFVYARGESDERKRRLILGPTFTLVQHNSTLPLIRFAPGMHANCLIGLMMISFQKDFLCVQRNLQVYGDCVFCVCSLCNMRHNASISGAIS